MLQFKSNSYEISARYALFYFSNCLYISDIWDGFGDCALTQVETDIIIQFNNLHNVEDVWTAIKHEYHISEAQQDAYVVFESYLNKLIDRRILVPGERTLPIVGEKGKCYPPLVTIELTDKCNFECTHCYKEAGHSNDCFLDTELAIRALESLKGKAWQVEFTGGEALLHPDFVKIVEHADFPMMSLLTNGSLLGQIPIETLKKFHIIQVSIYGTSDDEYIKYAHSKSFRQVCSNIKKLTDSGICVTVAVILRKTNYLRLQSYADLFSDLGVTAVRFGVTKKIGRNTSEISDWDMSYDDCCMFDKQLLELREHYPNIQFDDLDWESEFIAQSIGNKNDPHTLKCSAGKKAIVLSERGIVRPCALLPAEYFGKLHWNDYMKTVENGHTVCFDSCVVACSSAYKKEGKSIIPICSYAFG